MSNNKPRSQEQSSNRRARRREKQQNGASSEAGPSSLAPTRASSPKLSQGEPSTNGKKSFGDEDFIAFTVSDTEDAPAEVSPPEREWDKGKARAREQRPEHAGRKRKAAEVDLDDGYANKKQRAAASSRRAPWAGRVDWDSCTNVAEMLHKEVEAFVEYISPTPVEDEIRSLAVAQISEAVKKVYPDAQVLPFGSYETKLYLPTGDIDLVVQSKHMARMDKVSVLHSLANVLRRSGVTDRVTIIAKAKVPIVKFITTHGRFPVDISINQVNGVSAIKIVKQYLEELPALRALVLLIKSFLSQRSMNEVFSGGLGSFSIVCLAVSFLQMHPKIRRGEIDPSRNLGVLMMEFFELYGYYFNYQEVGISLRDGGSYYNKAQRGWQDYGQNAKLLSIEDPGDPSNDISRGSYNIAKVRTTLAGAYGIMAAAAYAQATIIDAKREGRVVRLRSGTDPEDSSILASVMGVTQETINHRRLVQEVYDRQVLHRLLGVAKRPTTFPSHRGNGAGAANRKSRAAEAESVREAWGEADMDMGSDGEDVDEREVEESRYDSLDRGRQPPKKRRRTGKPQDAHTVYTTDDDEGSVYRSDVKGNTTAEEEEYEDRVEEKGRDAGRRESAKRRSYWLSKAIPGGGESGDSDG